MAVTFALATVRESVVSGEALITLSPTYSGPTSAFSVVGMAHLISINCSPAVTVALGTALGRKTEKSGFALVARAPIDPFAARALTSLLVALEVCRPLLITVTQISPIVKPSCNTVSRLTT